MPCLLAT